MIENTPEIIHLRLYATEEEVAHAIKTGNIAFINPPGYNLTIYDDIYLELYRVIISNAGDDSKPNIRQLKTQSDSRILWMSKYVPVTPRDFSRILYESALIPSYWKTTFYREFMFTINIGTITDKIYSFNKRIYYEIISKHSMDALALGLSKESSYEYLTTTINLPRYFQMHTLSTIEKHEPQLIPIVESLAVEP